MKIDDRYVRDQCPPFPLDVSRWAEPPDGCIEWHKTRGLLLVPSDESETWMVLGAWQIEQVLDNVSCFGPTSVVLLGGHKVCILEPSRRLHRRWCMAMCFWQARARYTGVAGAIRLWCGS